MIQPLIQSIDAVLADVPRPVPLHTPAFKPPCMDMVRECVETGWVSSVGAYVTQFEEVTAAYTGAKHAVATNTGTAALHIAMLMAGVRPGDEVLCPSLTFVATGNAVCYCHATPHFIDVDPKTLGVCPAKLAEHLDRVAERRDGGVYNKQTGARIAAVVGMHAFGHPFDIDGLLKVCDRWGLPLVEDAAESLGSTDRGVHTGTRGFVGALSYNGNKTLTTGGGGMILCNDKDRADWARHISSTGKLPHRWAYHHDMVAYNYRMPNLNAALGCGQMKIIEDTIAAKRRVADRYREALADVPDVGLFDEPEGTRSNYWICAFVLGDSYAAQLDVVLEALHGKGILCRPIWEPLHTLPMFTDCPKADLSATDDMAQRVVNIPSSAHLDPQWADHPGVTA